MTDYSPSRKIVQTEELVFGAAASENTVKKIGGSLNHLLVKAIQPAQWKFNKKYGAQTGALEIVDASYFVEHDCSIYCFSMFNGFAGASGDTEIDIHRHTTSGAGTTIFTVRPKISYTAGDYAYMGKIYADTPTILENPTGTTLPTFVSLDLNAGDMLTFHFVTRQAGARHGDVKLSFRPR